MNSYQSTRFVCVAVISVMLTGCMVSSSDVPKRDASAAAKSYFDLGVAYFQRGRVKLAESKLQRSIESKPTPEAYNALAIMYEDQHENALSEETYKKLIAMFPAYKLGYSNYNIFLCKYDRLAQMTSLATQMSQQSPEIAAIGQVAAGDCAVSKGDNVSAEQQYKKALMHDAHSAGALLPLAEIDLKKGFVSEAKNKVDLVNNQVGYSPRSLKLSVLIERDLGNKIAERKMTNELRKRFPNTPEAKAILGR